MLSLGHGRSDHCAGYLGHPFEKIGILCMMDQVCSPKHVRCEYNYRDPFCSYSSSNAPISPRRGSIRALCIHLNEAKSMFQLSRDPRTFFALDKAIDNLIFAQNVCRGSVNFMVFALMGFPYESTSPLSQVVSSLQIRRSKLRHSHEGGNTMFHHVNHHALESAMSRALGLWYSYPGQFRPLLINDMQQDHSWPALDSTPSTSTSTSVISESRSRPARGA